MQKVLELQIVNGAKQEKVLDLHKHVLKTQPNSDLKFKCVFIFIYVIFNETVGV